jgi:hypothetical protein
MEYIAPLIQTILWVALLAGTLWRFNKSISGIFSALQKRIESGSNIKAGPFEITEQLKPVDPSKQQEKTAIEIQEAYEVLPSNKSKSKLSTQSKRVIDVRAKYFQIEDLVLRALQVEYGATISRQVTAGADMGFDGTFVLNGRLNIVEIKYTTNAGNISRYRITLERLINSINNYAWHNVQIILAIVFENESDIAKSNKQLREIADGLQFPVVVRCFSFSELQQKFGFTS